MEATSTSILGLYYFPLHSVERFGVDEVRLIDGRPDWPNLFGVGADTHVRRGIEQQ